MMTPSLARLIVPVTELFGCVRESEFERVVISYCGRPIPLRRTAMAIC
jgi:hypothetical protein